MIEQTFSDISLLCFERLSQEPGLAHAITTRPQNMAPHRGLDRENSIAWRQRVCEILGTSYEKLTSPEQVHGGEVLRVEDGDIGCGRDNRGSAMRFVDGLIVDKPGVPIVLLSADCPLVCAYDPYRHVAGAVHASWRGTVARISEQMVWQMIREFNCDPERLMTAIAPSAGPCCYEVDRQVYRVAKTKLADVDSCFAAKGDRYMFNLWEANRQQLINSGVSAENIEVAGLCSICDQRFWSHRRDGENAGRFGMFMALR